MKKEKKICKLKLKFKNLSKKKKIILISSLVILLIGLGVGIYFVTKKKPVPPVKKEDIIIAKDNFIYKNGKLLLIDPNNNEIGTYNCKNESADKCFVAYYDLEDEDLNTTKYKYNDATDVLIRSVIYKNKYVFINDGDDIVFYDLKDKKDLFNVLNIKQAEDNTIIVENLDKLYGVYSFSDNKYDEKISFEYTNLTYFNEKYVFIKDNVHGIMVDDENIITDQLQNKIVDFNDFWIIIKVGDVYMLTDYGNAPDDYIYDYLKIKDGLLFSVNNNKLSIKTLTFNKVNEERINLSNHYYNHVYIFDKDTNKKVKEEKAFDHIKEDMNLKVIVGNKDYLYNLYESDLNGNYKYVNYINGKLYIYKDEEKENLLHAYKCNNKNVITKSSKSFDNCFIAKEKVLLDRLLTGGSGGFLPIYNERFVFINDSKPLSLTHNILLLDISTDKTVGPYYNIDAGVYNLEGIFMVEPEEVLVMGENTTKKFGLFKIDKNELKSILPFKYQSIKYMSNYLLAKDETEYTLYTELGDKLASSTGEITDILKDKIIVKTQNNKYRVDTSTGTIVSRDFKHIILGNSFYAALNDNNEIEVYSYADKDNKIIKDPIKIVLTSNISYSYLFSDNGTIKITLAKQNGDYDTAREFSLLGEEIK